MAITTGARLGPYEILAPIGAGGMGEVWKARDTRLGRIVAIKVLPAHLSTNPDVRARFEREARSISQLSHAHICSLHDIGRQDDIDFLVMEYLEGETLAARLARGPLPPAEALRFGIEIVSALDSAHRSGIVHRDLKPGNIMLTKDGAKLMDFGLARAVALPPVAGALSESPTESSPLTAKGTIVGTFQYMAPEQLEGKEADPRTDLWALGCVLYEMATGKHAFEGSSQASLIASILKEEPRPVSELQPLAPPALEHLVRRCLAKDPAERWQSAGDVMHELKWIAEAGSQAGIPAPVVARRRRREWLAWALMILAVAVALVLFLMPRMKPRPPVPALARFAVTAPPGMTVVADGASIAVSPDGRRLAFIGADSTGVTQLCIRNLDSFAVQRLSGTDNAILPFWSPDSRFVAFFADGKLKKVASGGGSPEVICDAASGRGGSWSKDGTIIFAPQAMGPLLMIPADGGDVVVIARPDSARGETGLRFPCFLADGRHYIYVSLPQKQEGFDVYLGELNSKQAKRIMAAGGAPVCAGAGYLLFMRGNRLVAQEFDRRRLQPAGGVVPLGDAPPASSFAGAPLLSASENGVLIHAATSIPNTQLVWFDRTGRSLGPLPLPPASYGSPSISADGRWATVSIINSPTSADLWLIDLQRVVTTRLTFDGLIATGSGSGATAVWAPDGSRVAYMYNRSGIYDVYQVLTNGTGKPEPLVQSNVVFKTPVAWSPDGKYLVWSQNVEPTQWDIWLLPMQGDRKPVPYLRTPFDETTAAISPDGRWLAHDSNETGRGEVYVRSFPEPREKHRVSTSGGTAAQWSRDGHELIFGTSGQLAYTVGSIFSVDVQTSPSFKAGTPRLLFSPRQDLVGITATSDLKRFLAAVPVEGSAPPSITVTMNWQTLLKR